MRDDEFFIASTRAGPSFGRSCCSSAILGLHMTKLMESRSAAWQADLSRPGGCLAFLPMTADMKVVFRSPQYPGLVVKMSTALSDLLNEVISMQHFHSFPKSDIWARVP